MLVLLGSIFVLRVMLVEKASLLVCVLVRFSVFSPDRRRAEYILHHDDVKRVTAVFGRFVSSKQASGSLLGPEGEKGQDRLVCVCPPLFLPVLALYRQLVQRLDTILMVSLFFLSARNTYSPPSVRAFLWWHLGLLGSLLVLSVLRRTSEFGGP